MHCWALVAQGAGAADAAKESDFFGLLRARDITPFGFLRLDMRPTHALAIPDGGWGVEMELAYQNTWALSPQVERYLGTLEGRREIGPDELAAIRALPGENYLADFELGLLDVTFNYKFSSHWAAYLVLSGVHYGGGFLDSTIEGFHDTFGFSDFGRPAVVRNGTSYILDLKNSQVALFEAPTSGGMLDPTIGLRYSGLNFGRNWQVILEAAAKVPVRGRSDLLSTGRSDYGVQMTLQKFGEQPCVVHRRLCRLLRRQPEPRAERLRDHPDAPLRLRAALHRRTRTSSCRPMPVPASTRIAIRIWTSCWQTSSRPASASITASATG